MHRIYRIRFEYQRGFRIFGFPIYPAHPVYPCSFSSANVDTVPPERLATVGTSVLLASEFISVYRLKRIRILDRNHRILQNF